MAHYYNEFDDNAASWLEELIFAGEIPYGIVDRRSIEDVAPSDLKGFIQCHFFAGIGGWPLALRLAGFPEDREIWTGSCPCQPFSAAGAGAGFSDERHLWPAWTWLISQCLPAAIIGEQVASAAVGPWIDLVSTDLEAMGYAFGAYAGPAASVGAPHIRDRTYWVAHADSRQRQRLTDGEGSKPNWPQAGRVESNCVSAASSEFRRLADSHGRNACAEWEQRCGEQRQQPQDGLALGLAHGAGSGRREERAHAGRGLVGDRAQGFASGSEHGGGDHGSGPVNGHWRDADWLGCRDGKWRPVEPGTSPLAHGLPTRVGRLRGYGNAIVPQQAAEFIKAGLM